MRIIFDVEGDMEEMTEQELSQTMYNALKSYMEAGVVTKPDGRAYGPSNFKGWNVNAEKVFEGDLLMPQ